MTTSTKLVQRKHSHILADFFTHLTYSAKLSSRTQWLCTPMCAKAPLFVVIPPEMAKLS